MASIYISFIAALVTYLNSVHGIQFPPNQHWFCAIGTAVLWSATLSSTLFILNMTFDKVYSILRPHKASSFNTVKRAKITVTCVIVFSSLYNIPYLFIITNNGPQCVTDLLSFKNRFFFWLSYVVHFVIPFISLLSMNSIIIHILRTRTLLKNTQSKVQTPNSVQRVDKQTFVILLLVAFSFFVLITPLYAFTLYVEFVDISKSPKAFAGFYIFYQVMHKLYYTNNAINFFLYVISGRKFRNDLIRLFKFSKGTPAVVSSVSDNNTNITSLK